MSSTQCNWFSIPQCRRVAFKACQLAKTAGGRPRRIREAIADLHHFTDRFLHLPPGAERTLHAAIASSNQTVNDLRWFAPGVFAPKPADFDEDAVLAVLAADPVDAPEPKEGRALLDSLCDLGDDAEQYRLDLPQRG